MENSKTSRYFKYAFGEIILVVIGILIALQINNWNQNRQNKKEEIRILKNLKADLVKDTLELNKNIKTTLKRDATLSELLELLAVEKEYKKRKIIEFSMYNIPFLNYFQVNSGTFDESVASGSIKFIENDSLRQHIFNYYRDTKLNFNDEGVKNNTDRSIPVFFSKIMTTNDVMSLFGSKSRLPKIDFNKLGKDVEFMALITEKLASQGEQRKAWRRYLSNARIGLRLINKELKDN